MKQPVQLSICRTCRPERSRGRGITGGWRLHDAVMERFAPWLHREGVEVVLFDCLGACGRSCTASLRAVGKVTVVLGDLDPEGAAAPLAEYAIRYARSASGHLPRQERPAPLRHAVVARLPPTST